MNDTEKQPDAPAQETPKPPAKSKTPPPAPPKQQPRRGETYADAMVKGRQRLEEKRREDSEKADVAQHIYALRCTYTADHDAIFFTDGYIPRQGVAFSSRDWYSTYHRTSDNFPEANDRLEVPWCQDCFVGGRRTALPLKVVVLPDRTVGHIITEPWIIKKITREEAEERVQALIARTEEAARE